MATRSRSGIRKARRYGAVGRGADTTAKPSRPAPKTQPGPVRQAERKKTEQFKKTPTYRRAIKSGKRRAARDQARDITHTGDTARSIQDVQDLVVRAREGNPPSGREVLDTVKRAPNNGKGLISRSEGFEILSARQKQAAANSAAIKVLDQFNRVPRATAATARTLVKTGNPVKAAGEGVKAGVKNKGKLWGDTLRDAGLPNAVAAPLGFTADLATDPTTYTTFGAAPVARKTAEKAAQQATRKAVKAGMSKTGQQTVARAAAKTAELAAPKGKGVTMRFAGREVASVNRATGAASRGARRVAAKTEKIPGVRVVARGSKKTGAAVKDTAREVRPMLTPAGAREAEHVASRQAARKARAATTQGVAQAEREARDLAKRMGEANYELVLDAIERGKIGTLPDHLVAAAVDIRSKMRYAKRVRARAGLAEGTIGGKSSAKTTKAERVRLTQQAQELEQRAARVRAAGKRNTIGKRAADPLADLGPLTKSQRRYRNKANRLGTPRQGVKVGSRRYQQGQKQLDRAKAMTARAQQIREQAKTFQAERGFFPHAQEEPLLQGLGITDGAQAAMGRGGRTIPQPGSSRRRELRMPVSEANPKLAAEGKGRFSTDVPLVYLNYMDETAKVGARSQLVKDLAATGRKAKPGAHLDDGDAVYHLGFKDNRFGLREVNPTEVGKASGQYVILNRKVVDRTLESAAPKQAQNTIGRGYDKFTRGWKTIATATPGFHARNMVGDTQMGYLAQPTHKMPGNMKKAGGVLRVASKREREPFNREASGRTIPVAGKPMPVEEFEKLAREHGVIRSGYVGRELEDLAASSTTAAKSVKGRGAVRAGGRKLNRWMQNREDLMRVATFKDALDRGMKAEDAADRAMNFHIDYGDLTEFERKVMRRAAPFYTFSARALPMHAKALVQTPGKFAAIEKARQEVAAAFGDTDKADETMKTLRDLGVDPKSLGFEDWQDFLQEYQQRQAPLLIGGNVISDALPLTVLNELPTSFNPSEYVSELAQWGVSLANPIGKWPIELFANKNLFLRKDIEPDERPLVSAPVWVKALPDKYKKAWGVTDEYVDPRTGKKTLGWRGKPDYIARTLPGVFGFVNTMLTEGSNRRGQNPEQRAAAFVTGVRSEPYDPTQAAMSALLERRREVKKDLGALRQQDKTAENREYRELDATRKLIEWQINALSVKHGDAVPFFDGAKKPTRYGKRIAELEARRDRLSEPLRARAQGGGMVFETPELKKIRAEIKRLKDEDGQKPVARVRPLPETPAEEVARELDEFRKGRDPKRMRDEIEREIAAFRQGR